MLKTLKKNSKEMVKKIKLMSQWKNSKPNLKDTNQAKPGVPHCISKSICINSVADVHIK